MIALRRRRSYAALVVAPAAVALAWALLHSAPGHARGSDVVPISPSAVDVGFSQAMSLHHQQAVTMAQILLRGRGATQEARALASNIELDQVAEIGRMGGWLALWNQPPAASGSPMAWMTKNVVYYCGLTHGAMPGLATQFELDRLARLSGERLDTYFMQLMLRHHEGGVEMALYAARYAHVRAVRNLARNIVLDQTQEIALMSRLLRLAGARPLPFTESVALAHSDVGSVLNGSPALR
jgi:uncharacterized protein (DUF305 family)